MSSFGEDGAKVEHYPLTIEPLIFLRQQQAGSLAGAAPG